ncbi:MAG: UDP-N-acetylmuramoyl-L-alanyl-D-glutamate--2,6-diaminopimelate ligase [Phycisphaerae bacterium]
MNEPPQSNGTPGRSLLELLGCAGLDAEVDRTADAVIITSLADDSRRVQEGSCFVAVRGERCDGHGFLNDAVRRGARAVVVDKDDNQSLDAVRVRVHDTREAIARLAAAYYGLRDERALRPRLIGVTGTNGKTTVAWLLRAILQAAGYRVALLGTVEYDLIDRRMQAPLTTPGPIDLCRHVARARDAGADWAVLEVSSHALQQRRTDGVSFSVGVFTNLSGDHLDYHGTMDRYWRSKRRLFEALGGDATAVINFDDPVGELMASDLQATVLAFGIDSCLADVRAVGEAPERRGTRFTVKTPSFEVDMLSPLVGRINVLNVVAATAAARTCSVAPEVIRRAVETFSGVPGRLQRVSPPDGAFAVFVDYAHTDEALRHALEAVRPLTTGRLICVFGCGGDRDRLKRPRMAAVVEHMADVAYVTSDNPRSEDPQAIIDDILPGFGSRPRTRIEVEVDRRRAIETAIAEARTGDTVLITGKGHETYQLVGGQVLDFDDAKVARSCLYAAVPEGAS